jgi:hypothetical protein
MYLSHLQIPHEQWPGEKIYFYCPACDEVIGLPKGEKNTCPDCGKSALKDIFTEISERLNRSWSFFGRTRYEDDPWLFRYKPDGPVSFFATNLAMALYGELRAFGIRCPWEGTDNEIIDTWIDARLQYVDPETGLIDCSGTGGYLWYPLGSHMSISHYVSKGLAATLDSRLFEPNRYTVPVEARADNDSMESVESFKELLPTLPDSYGGGSWVTNGLLNHQKVIEERDGHTTDEMMEYVHSWLDRDQDPQTGRWLAFTDKKYNPEVIANGMFKIMVSYQTFNWKINYPEQIIDFLIDVRADPRSGFDGESTCSIFDPMMVAWVLRNRGCDHRKEEINEIVAKSFLAFNRRWDHDLGWFKNGTWQEKHNNGVPPYMAGIILELPFMNITDFYNWRRNPILDRLDNGTIKINDVIYTAE